MIFKDALLAGSTLIREAIQSANYAAGIRGWRIAQDGTAEFNNVTIRGGTQVSGTSLYYDGTPGPHKLLLAIAAQDGTDIYGNSYQAGLSVYENGNIQAHLGYHLGSLGGGGISTFLVKGGTQYYSSVEGSEIELGKMGAGGTTYPLFPAQITYTHLDDNTNTLTLTSGVDSSGQDLAAIGINSESTVGAGDASVNVSAKRFLVNTVDQGRGIVASANLTSNHAITTTLNTAMTTEAIVWEQGRVYRVEYDGLISEADTTHYCQFTFIKGVSAGGTVWRSQMRQGAAVTSVNFAVNMSAFLTPTTTFSSAMSLGVQMNSGGSGTLPANSTASMHTLNVIDVGVSTNYAAIPIS